MPKLWFFPIDEPPRDGLKILRAHLESHGMHEDIDWIFDIPSYDRIDELQGRVRVLSNIDDDTIRARGAWMGPL